MGEISLAGFSQAKIIKIRLEEEEKPSGQTSQVFVSAWNAILFT